MSGSPVNLQRDSYFISPEKAPLDFSDQVGFDESTALKTDADPTVYDAYTQARSSRDNNVIISGASNVRAIGVYLRPPGSELSPYRVRCFAKAIDPLLEFRLVIGYAEGTITGTDDLITHYSTLGFDKYMDEIFMIESQTTTGTAPIFFGIMVKEIVAGTKVDANISVQRLATSPPQFSQSVS